MFMPLPSSGFHSNGFSLIRKVFDSETRLKYNISLDDLLIPTRIYVKDILKFKDDGVRMTGLCHVTGVD